jgi:hypothetical protein
MLLIGLDAAQASSRFNGNAVSEVTSRVALHMWRLLKDFMAIDYY